MDDAGGVAEPEIAIDDRYRGAHGIGRYASEVISRFTVPWVPAVRGGSPSSPRDAFRRLPREVADRLIYSPGYGAFVRARRQVLTVHDLIHLAGGPAQTAPYRAYYDLIVRPTIRRTGTVLTVSETSRRYIESWLRDDSVEIVNAGIGCSPAFVSEGDHPRPAMPYLMYVGNLRVHKNVDVVLDALPQIEDVELRMLLPQAELDEARERIRSRGLEDRVTLMSGLGDEALASQYRGAACTVFPSTLEGFGLPPLESIMCGTPVVYWSGCDAVAETASGFGPPVESAHDPAEWASVITAELRDPARDVLPVGRY